MTGIQYPACLWTLFIIQTGLVCSDLIFLDRHEGESVVFPCEVEPTNRPPIGVYLRRRWLQPDTVLFMLSQHDFSSERDKHRLSVSGDPSSRSVNVTMSQLRAGDTDHYYCEFVVERPSAEDERIRGRNEFFLLVTADVHGSVDIGLVEVCPGGSAVLPCLPPNGEGLVVEGVTLKRQKSRAPVEMLYHWKHHLVSSPPSSSSSQFPAERVQLSLAPGPSGITYNLTLQQLQPDDSALYSCQLLVPGRSNSITSLGRRVFFVSVQGSHCSCTSSSTLLYALSSGLAVLLFLILILIAFVAICRGKPRRSEKSRPLVPIYEEMAGVQPLSRKLAPHCLEETDSSEYRNCPVKRSCPENHYESPNGGICPRS